MQTHFPIFIFIPVFFSLLISSFLLDLTVNTMEGEVLIAFLREDGSEESLKANCQIFMIFSNPLQDLIGEKGAVKDLDLRVNGFYGGLLRTKVAVGH